MSQRQLPFISELSKAHRLSFQEEAGELITTYSSDKSTTETSRVHATSKGPWSFSLEDIMQLNETMCGMQHPQKFARPPRTSYPSKFQSQPLERCFSHQNSLLTGSTNDMHL